MSIGEIIILSFGVSFDAFAVSVSIGNSYIKTQKWLPYFVGLTFGLFQMMMPIIGYFLGKRVYMFVNGYVDIITFLIFFIIGINMVYESFSKDSAIDNNLSLRKLLFLAIATSLDAFVLGITLYFNCGPILFAGVSFFTITFVTSVVGGYLGHFFGTKYANKSKLFGGLILLLLGLKCIYNIFL